MIVMRILALVVGIITLRADAGITPGTRTQGGGPFIGGQSASPGVWALGAGADHRYPIFSDRFTAPDNPFHMTVKSLVARGALLQPHTLMDNLWSQGYHFEDTLNYPLYQGLPGQPKYNVQCTFYGNCNPKNHSLHLPSGALPEAKGDHHITSIDVDGRFEFDGWGGASSYGGGPCSVGQTVNCSWGGFYPFSGKGLASNGAEGNHGGFALGLFTVTAQELLQGHIDHALGLDSQCLDDPPVYPADTKNLSDQTCAGGVGPQPAPSYGMMVHLIDAYDIAGAPYSRPCKTLLRAMQKYGAYLYDTGNHGLFVALESPQTYVGENPWYTRIFPEMATAGDASGSDASWQYSSCLSHVTAKDFEIYVIPNLGY